MVPVRHTIVDEPDLPPEPELREVLDSMGSMTPRSTVEEEPLLAVSGILSGESMSAQEIEQELCGDAGASEHRT